MPSGELRSRQRPLVVVTFSWSRYKFDCHAGDSHANSGVDDYTVHGVTHGDKFTFNMGELCGYKKHPAIPAQVSLVAKAAGCKNQRIYFPRKSRYFSSRLKIFAFRPVRIS